MPLRLPFPGTAEGQGPARKGRLDRLGLPRGQGDHALEFDAYAPSQSPLGTALRRPEHSPPREKRRPSFRCLRDRWQNGHARSRGGTSHSGSENPGTASGLRGSKRSAGERYSEGNGSPKGTAPRTPLNSTGTAPPAPTGRRPRSASPATIEAAIASAVSASPPAPGKLSPARGLRKRRPVPAGGATLPNGKRGSGSGRAGRT